jgi:Amino acid permease
MADTTSSAGLRRDAIGLREVLFQSITHMAPAAAVAFSIIVGAQFAAGALPLSVIFALVGCLLVAISIGQLAKHLPSAGGFATYASTDRSRIQGLGTVFGAEEPEPTPAPAEGGAAATPEPEAAVDA